MTDFDQGRAAAALSIRKAQHLPRDLVRDSFASNVRSRLDVSTRMIKAVHSRGPTPPDDDADVAAMPLTKAERTAIRRAKKPKKTQVSMRGLAEIRDAHKKGGVPLTGDFLSKVQPITATQNAAPLQKRDAPGVRWENVKGTWLQVEHLGSGRSRVLGGLAKGLKVPPESDNASNATDIADVGSTNDWDDEDVANPTPEHVGEFNDVDASRSPAIAAAVASTPRETPLDAIKRALLPENKKRMMP